MLIVDMTKETRDKLLRDIKRILNDVQNYKHQGGGELFKSLDILEDDLEIFANDLEIELREYWEWKLKR